ncbi:MAG: amidohydrolase family protein [Planctomycetes bacterium]|nr:amidohydrolase family protein [Planctomycetota bacterium]
MVEHLSKTGLVLLADWVVGPAGTVLSKAGVGSIGGVIERIFTSHGEGVRWAREVGAGDPMHLNGVLAPGWVNAHCHLELTGLAGRISCEGGFPQWIGRLMKAKSEFALEDYRQGVITGAQALLAGGTTSVGDIDSQGVMGRVESPLRMRVYRESLDAFHPQRTPGALEWVRKPMECSGLRGEGLAPHASFTVSPALMRGMARLARGRAAPVTVHWSETQAEVDWLLRGEGRLADVLGPSPRCSGLHILEEAGLLNGELSLAHGNWPAPGEEESIAQADATLVHCPGSHQFFGREPFPLRRYLDAGVRVALGTDSQASNQELDMGREVALLRKNFPWVDPRMAFCMGTEHGARAIGWGTSVGRIQEGFHCDLMHVDASVQTAADAMELLTGENPPVAQVWVDGRSVLTQERA